MRGKLTAFDGQPIELGITPADAGKTRNAGIESRKIKDHPRGCGENNKMFTFSAQEIGSPPRMRGKPELNEKTIDEIRITPADAGKTIIHVSQRLKA